MTLDVQGLSYGIGQPPGTSASRWRRKNQVASRRLWADVTEQAHVGGTVAIIGPNGCGKSMLLKVLATLIKPWSGQILWQGEDIAKGRRAYRRQVSYSSSAPLGFYGRLNAFENLRFFGGLAGSVPRRAAIEQALADVALDVDDNTMYSHFSLGMRQRLHLARLLVADRPIWLLDEPSNGLDSSGLVVLEKHLKPADDQLKIFVSHDHSLIAEVATSVVDLGDYCDA